MLARVVATMSIILCIVTTNVYSDPSISGAAGAFRSGEAATIQGSGFGIKSSAAPLKYDSFEQIGGSYEAGDTIANGWGYTPPSAAYSVPIYDSSDCRSGSTKHARCRFRLEPGDSHWGSTFYYNHGATLSPLYVTFWIKRQHLSGIETDNEKYFRVTYEPRSPTGEEPLVGHSIIGTGGGSCTTGIRGEDGQWIGDGKWWGSYGHDTWHRFEGYYVESSPFGAGNGSVDVWFQYGGEGNRFTHTVGLTTDTNNAGSDRHWRGVIFGKYVRLGQLEGGIDPNTAYRHDFDDVYIDNTPARVEIGDNENWNACTHREIQIPTAWAEGEITVTVNQGSFGHGDAYVFVVDNNGVPSPGHKITIEPSVKRLANVINHWQAGELTRDDVNLAVYWYMKGTMPAGDPMDELTEEDIGNAIKLVGEQ